MDAEPKRAETKICLVPAKNLATGLSGAENKTPLWYSNKLSKVFTLPWNLFLILAFVKPSFLIVA